MEKKMDKKSDQKKEKASRKAKTMKLNKLTIKDLNSGKRDEAVKGGGVQSQGNQNC
jgi:hypothetical protein